MTGMQATFDLKSLIGQGALFVANHSGGKDSQACLISLLEQGVPASQILVVHASLGRMEWPGALEKAQEHALAHNLPFIVAKASKSLLDMVQRRYDSRPGVPSWPSSSTRQCTSDLKRDPITKAVRAYANQHGYSIIVNCLGIRALESSARAKKQVFTRNERNWTATRSWYEWFPIFELTVEQVFTSIAASGQELHYAYGLGNERLSCVFCIMGSTGDCQNGAKHNPGLFQEYVALEHKTGYTMHQSRLSLTEIIFGTELGTNLLAA
jgi:3'-phosphoadenosine 5'-phosphosulfate sulfotransferase (PAPS reductase)/FAD synthetase